MDNRAFTLLGMHRSGTSCITAMLEQAGVNLGSVSRKNKFNLKGNYESQLIMDLNDRLLAANGGNWELPPQTVTWSPCHKQLRDEIITSYADVDCWGFKDPRTLFTLDGWLDVLPELNLIGVFRHPHSVASSLHFRNSDISIEKGYQIWLAYNEKLYNYLIKYEFPLIKFEAGGLLDSFAGIIKKLKLHSERQSKWEKIYDASLHTKARQHIRLPHEVDMIFHKLNELVS